MRSPASLNNTYQTDKLNNFRNNYEFSNYSESREEEFSQNTDEYGKNEYQYHETIVESPEELETNQVYPIITETKPPSPVPPVENNEDSFDLDDLTKEYKDTENKSQEFYSLLQLNLKDQITPSFDIRVHNYMPVYDVTVEENVPNQISGDEKAKLNNRRKDNFSVFHN